MVCDWQASTAAETGISPDDLAEAVAESDWDWVGELAAAAARLRDANRHRKLCSDYLTDKIIDLHEGYGVRVVDIAQVLKVGRNAVYKRINRGYSGQAVE